MLTVGGAISGYSEIGSARFDQRAGDGDDDRQHRREDRPIDEEVGEAHGAVSTGLGATPRPNPSPAL